MFANISKYPALTPLIGSLAVVSSLPVQARETGVVVNAIYCGNGTDEMAIGWQEFAQFAGGMYASIDQGAAALANIETPMDQRLIELNQALNKTYIAFGALGEAAAADK